MRCPKCQYISFDSGDRCRNCGYEFSLSVDVTPVDLPIQTGDEAIGPLRDFVLTEKEESAPSRPPVPAAPALGAFGPTPPAQSPPSARRPSTGSLDLPLFKDRVLDDDTPLVSTPATPRVPLSVRRSGPPLARPPRQVPEDQDLGLEADAPRSRATLQGHQHLPVAEDVDHHPVAAEAGRRLLAAVIDALLLGAIDVAILYFTLQICGLRFSDIEVLPRMPLIGFLLLLNGAYFVVFTVAGGQTVGKMAAGIRVVPAAAEVSTERVPLGTAVVRSAAYLVTLLPAGLGYLPALFGQERRAIHDRLADTRVVQA
jgi:uncharacterized RDD family membrane protein YckC